MPEPNLPADDVEHVLSAIRRLIEQGRADPRPKPPEGPLVLTPSQRIEGGPGTPADAAPPAEAFDGPPPIRRAERDAPPPMILGAAERRAAPFVLGPALAVAPRAASTPRPAPEDAGRDAAGPGPLLLTPTDLAEAPLPPAPSPIAADSSLVPVAEPTDVSVPEAPAEPPLPPVGPAASILPVEPLLLAPDHPVGSTDPKPAPDEDPETGRGLGAPSSAPDPLRSLLVDLAVSRAAVPGDLAPPPGTPDPSPDKALTGFLGAELDRPASESLPTPISQAGDAGAPAGGPSGLSADDGTAALPPVAPAGAGGLPPEPAEFRALVAQAVQEEIRAALAGPSPLRDLLREEIARALAARGPAGLP